ncbi:hypothetical protein MK338_08950, partial [Streptococcus vestibularis]|nr:hypothetical protein [Streptococcus vestibularis]
PKSQMPFHLGLSQTNILFTKNTHFYTPFSEKYRTIIPYYRTKIELFLCFYTSINKKLIQD